MKNKNKLGALVFLVGLMGVLLANAQSAFKADGLVESTAGGFKFPDGSVQKTSAIMGGPYVIGGTGPAGGIVYFATTDGLHGMEAAPSDISPSPTNTTTWGCFGTKVGAFASGIGSGARNTDAILRGCGSSGSPAALADQSLSTSLYFDWHLPTKNDLALMYKTLYLNDLGDFCVGGPPACYYWSSSEVDAERAWLQDFTDGSQDSSFKLNEGRVRAVRAF